MLRRYDPFGSFMSLREAMNRLFEESFVGERFEIMSGKTFPINMYETTDPKQLVIEAAIAGVKPDDIHVQVEGDTVTIRANQKQEEKTEKGDYVRREITQNEMYRAVTLPAPIDAEKVEATYEHGILTLRLPKVEAPSAKEIPIKMKELAKA